MAGRRFKISCLSVTPVSPALFGEGAGLGLRGSDCAGVRHSSGKGGLVGPQ